MLGENTDGRRATPPTHTERRHNSAQVGNIAFSEHFASAYPAVLAAVAAVDAEQAAAAAAAEAAFVAQYATDPLGAVEAITQFSVANGQRVFEQVGVRRLVS